VEPWGHDRAQSHITPPPAFYPPIWPNPLPPPYGPPVSTRRRRRDGGGTRVQVERNPPLEWLDPRGRKWSLTGPRRKSPWLFRVCSQWKLYRLFAWIPCCS